MSGEPLLTDTHRRVLRWATMVDDLGKEVLDLATRRGPMPTNHVKALGFLVRAMTARRNDTARYLVLRDLL